MSKKRHFLTMKQKNKFFDFCLSSHITIGGVLVVPPLFSKKLNKKGVSKTMEQWIQLSIFDILEQQQDDDKQQQDDKN